MNYYKSKKGNKVLCLDHNIEDDLRYKHSLSAWKSVTKKEYDSYVARKNAVIRIAFLKKELAKTDYRALKYVEGYYTNEEYEQYKNTRQALRNEINELQSLLNQVEEVK